MLVTLSHLPKWLLALVALCVLTGYADQVKCKTVGCENSVSSAKADAVHGKDKPAPSQDDEHDCQCQCHFATLTFEEAPAFHVSFVRAVAAPPPVWVGSTPEAPCSDIEHPPQLA